MKLLKKMLICAVFAAATFAVAFVLGNAITMTLGPGTSGIVTIVFTTIVMVIGARVVNTFWAFTIMVTLFTCFAIPTNIFGPPHPLKILIGFATGLSYDLCHLVFRQFSQRFALPISAAVSTAVSILLIYWLMLYFEHPRAEYMAGILKYIAPLYAVLGFVGGLLGNNMFAKYLENLSITRQLQSGNSQSVETTSLNEESGAND